VLIALTPAVCMFLFSFNLMNRSIDGGFLRIRRSCAKTRRGVLELAQYVTDNARVERSRSRHPCSGQGSAALQDELERTVSRWAAVLPLSTARTCIGYQLSSASGGKPGKPAPWLPEKNEEGNVGAAVLCMDCFQQPALRCAKRR